MVLYADGWCQPRIPYSFAARYFVTYQMFEPRLARVTPAYFWWCRWKYFKFKSP